MTDKNHKCPKEIAFSCSICNPSLDKATEEIFTQTRIITLLGYSTALVMDYKNGKAITSEDQKKIDWFFENVERVIYRKLPMTECP